ncbi:unnamed protein product [Prorocentrum cordatum]|uniref:Uncharacterized protein n=1 Tax=Prorocentrum cordatum TaxID=2364126 RepID=A0ABN9TLL7_9DINO|nr:unnamed protein product [Polarella glacialis]
MRDAKVESNAISFNAGIAACAAGMRWQQALSLLGDMREARLEPDVVGYTTGISACGSCERWQQALSLLGGMREAELEPNVHLQCWDQRVQKWRAVAARSGAAQRNVGGTGRA